MTMTKESDAVRTAVHTAVSELGDAHEDDILDCVYGMVGAAYDEVGETAIRAMIRGLR